jgi:hypothetical protein
MAVSDTATKIAILKHLSAGRDLDFAAQVTRVTVEQARQVATAHGHPDPEKMQWAVEHLQAEIDDASDLTNKPATDIPAPRAPRAAAAPKAAAAKPADDIRDLIIFAKNHPAKRIQAAGKKLLDDIDKLRRLLAEDQEKNAARRQADAEKAAVRAEVERLQAQLAEAKAKLKTNRSASSKPTSDGPPAGMIRAWARANGMHCPDRGVLPRSIRDAYAAAHTEDAA